MPNSSPCSPSGKRWWNRRAGDRQAVAAPERVAQVIAARRGQAAAAGLSPEVAEAVWQAMIAAFIRLETETNQAETFAKPQI